MVEKILLKTAIFIAVFFSFCFELKAQEYNNWLFYGGAILNFDTSPATVLCDDNNNFAGHGHIVALSDNNGQLILYGYKEPTNGNTSISDYVIKNKDKVVVRISTNEVTNAIGCKLSQGVYYIAAVLRTNAKAALHVYKFDNDGNLKNEYTYNDGNYSFFLDFIRIDDFIALIAYRNNQIETYKLTSEECILWNKKEMKLDNFLYLTTPSFDIEHSLDYSIIIATAFNIAYVLNFDKSNGEVTILHRFESDKFRTMSFSPTDKYFLIIDDEKLNGFKYSKDFNFVLDKPDVIYNLPKKHDVVCNLCWEMAVGVDGKLYIHELLSDFIIVLDGIESENITKTIIQADCLQYGTFPRIPRTKDNQGCMASAHFDNAVVCFEEPLNIFISGAAPYEVSYTLNGELKTINTDKTEFQIDNIPGSYKLTKITDSNGCEAEPDNNNTAIIVPKLQKLIIKEEK